MSCNEILYNNLVTTIFVISFCFVVITVLSVALLLVWRKDRKQNEISYEALIKLLPKSK